MDVTFKEDDSRIRGGVAAENMSVMRHLTLLLIRKSLSQRFQSLEKDEKLGFMMNIGKRC